MITPPRAFVRFGGGNRCDYGSLHDALLDYLSALTRAGVGLLVVVDGMQDVEKEATTLDRRRSQVCVAGHVRRQRREGLFFFAFLFCGEDVRGKGSLPAAARQDPLTYCMCASRVCSNTRTHVVGA